MRIDTFRIARFNYNSMCDKSLFYNNNNDVGIPIVEDIITNINNFERINVLTNTRVRFKKR